MGYSSQGGHLVARTQLAKGTFESDIVTAGVAMKTKGGNLEPKRDLLSTDPEIGAGRDVPDAYLGAVSWAGDIEFYVRMQAITTWMYAALGTKGVSTTTGVSTHTITPSDAALLPFLSVEQKISSGLEVFHYTDVVVNTLHLECEANGYLMGTVGLIAIKEVAGATALTSVELAVVDDDSPMTVGTNITATLNGVALPAKSFTIDINNNFEDDDFKLGSFYLNQLSPKRREINGSFTVRPETSALFRRATYGGAALTEAAGTTVKDALVISCQTYEDIPAGIPATKYSIGLTVPKIALTPFSLPVSGDDMVENDIEFTALRPAVATPIITAVIKNDVATIA